MLFLSDKNIKNQIKLQGINSNILYKITFLHIALISTKKHLSSYFVYPYTITLCKKK